MKITEYLRSLLERWGLLTPRVAQKARAKRKAPVRRKPAVSHAAATRIELLNAVADALGRAPAEFDPLQPKATIAANGSLYTVHNTVAALTEFQTRLEKLQTTVKQPGVSRQAITSCEKSMAKQRRDAEDTKAYFEKQRQQQPTT